LLPGAEAFRSGKRFRAASWSGAAGAGVAER